MPYITETRGYWKVKRIDLEQGQDEDCIIFPINGTGANWQGGIGRVVVYRDTPEWTFLFENIANQQCFINKNEQTNSKNVPVPLRGCFQQEGTY